MVLSHYFEGRKKIQKSSIQLGKASRLEWSAYEKWVDTEQGVELACGITDTVTFSIASGISEKELTSLVSKIGSSIGIKDVAAISSEITASLGYEVNWSVTKTLTHSTSCTAPKCGRYALEIRQLVREYELTLYTKTGFIFKSWDRQPTRTIVEKTEKHSLWPTVEEYDQRCKGCKEPVSPGYDGRLIVEAGNAICFFPYKVTGKGVDIRVFNKVVAFEFTTLTAGLLELQHGTGLDFPEDAFSAPLRFFVGEIASRGGRIRVHGRIDHRPAFVQPPYVTPAQVTVGRLITGIKSNAGKPLIP
jgi:hypothetical protein